MKIFALIGGSIAVILLGLYIWLWGAQTGHGLTMFWIAGWPVIVGVLIMSALTVFAIRAFMAHDDASFSSSYSYGSKKPKDTKTPNYLTHAWVFTGLSVLALLGIIMLAFVLPYVAGHKYAGSVKTTTTAAANYAQRDPYQVAVQASSRNLQNVTGDAQDTKSLPGASTNGDWNTLVIRRGVFQGYEATQSIQTPLFGTVSEKQVNICYFAASSQLRLGGSLPHNNLNRAIDAATAPNVTWDDDDAYSYCDGSTPIVVVPLKQISGFFGATWTFYGDAVYNGKTGALSILTDSKSIKALSGSVYPLSLAEDTRSAYQASGGFWDWLQNRTGYDSTASDADDPNGGNTGEFNLREANTSHTDYVTPLLPRGSSSTVVALGVVDSRNPVSGTRTPLIVHLYPKTAERQAPSTVENQIRTAYSHMTDWAAGLSVYEVIPESDGNWVASLGFKQSVDYRAYVTASGKVTLFNEAVQELNTSGNPVDSTPATTPSTGSGTTVTSTSDLSKLTTAQLQALVSKLLAENSAVEKELASRAK